MKVVLKCAVLLTLARTMMVQVSGDATINSVVSDEDYSANNITMRVAPVSSTTTETTTTTTTTNTTRTTINTTTTTKVNTHSAATKITIPNRTTTAHTITATTTIPTILTRAVSATTRSPPTPSRSPSSHYRQRLYFPAALHKTPSPSFSSTSTLPFSSTFPSISPASFFAFHVPGERTSPMVSMFYNVGPSSTSPSASPPAFFRAPPQHSPPPSPLPVIHSTLSSTSPSSFPTPQSLTSLAISVPLSHPRPHLPTSSSFPLPLSHPSLSYPYYNPLWRPPFPSPVRRERTIPSTAPPPPYFDIGIPSNVTAQQGTHAFLSCIVRNLGNQSISWVRSRDSHILTVDRYTFIADQRFQARYHADEERWTLQVKFVQGRDDGRYECQVSTEPKISRFVYFHVVTPLVHIPGGPDMYVKSGSRVTIKCVITAALHQPQYIFWYQGKERVVAR